MKTSTIPAEDPSGLPKQGLLRGDPRFGRKSHPDRLCRPPWIPNRRADILAVWRASFTFRLPKPPVKTARLVVSRTNGTLLAG